MLELIKTKSADEFIGYVEWWKIGNHCKASISFCEKQRAIHITDVEGKDITPIIAKKMDIKLIGKENDITEIRLNRTIDAYFIECSEDVLMSLLKQIDSIC